MTSTVAHPPIYHFDDVTVDRANFRILKQDRLVEIEPRAFELLVYLLEHRGRVVQKQEIFEHVWRETFVTDNALTREISELRRVLRDKASAPRYIETVHKHGYCFIAEVKVGGEAHPTGQPAGAPAPQEPPAGQIKAPVNPAVQGVGLSSEPDTAEGAKTGKDSGGSNAPERSRERKGLTAGRRLGLAAALALAAGAALWLYFPRPAMDSKSAAPPMKATNFTSHPGEEYDPSFSPDGNQIAFTWNEGKDPDIFHIYVKLIGAETLLPITTDPALDGRPVWSPDGTHIAFARMSEGGGIFIVPALGGPRRKLLPVNWGVQILFAALDWSPDGKYIAYAERGTPREAFGIFLVSPDSGEKRRLTSPPARPGYGDRMPAFSPDGQSLAFIRTDSDFADDIYVVPVAGGAPRRLTSDNALIPCLAWTADGREIIFSSNRGGGLSLWRIAVAGGSPEPLPVGEGAWNVAVSRQGDRLVYAKTFFSRVSIWRIDLPTSTSPSGPPVELIPSTRTQGNTQYSPDGKRIVFESSRSGSPEIWTCDVDGSNLLQLTRFGGPVTGAPRWSPDGRWVAFDSRPEGHGDLYVISAEGGQPRRVTTETSHDIAPSWSHDGRWLYFGSDRSGEWQIWKVPVGGGEEVQVTKQGGTEAFEAPDGRFVYYTKILIGKGFVPGLWRVPAEGGEETLFVEGAAERAWAVVGGGIYFVRFPARGDTKAHPELEYFDPSTGRVRRVVSFDKEPFPTVGRFSGGLSVSPDGRRALFNARQNVGGSDIILVDNFR